MKPKGSKYKAEVSVGGIAVSLGNFVSAEEAALHIARHKAKAEAASSGQEVRVDLTADQAIETAVREGLKLVPADNKTGFSCVKPIGSKYKAEVSVGGIAVYLGIFVTAEEAALHVARHKAKADAEAAAAAGSGSSRKRPAEAPPKSMATISGSEHLVKAPRLE